MTPEQNSAVRFPTRLAAITLVLTFATLWWVVWTTRVDNRNIDLQTHNSRLEQLNGIIMRLDEVLTMSARMAAVTGELRWEERYRQHEPELDAAIKDAMALASQIPAFGASKQTDAANARLVAMENRAFALVRDGRSQEARALLFSPTYEDQKAIYAGGMNALMAGAKTQLDTKLRQARAQSSLLIAGSIVLFGVSIGAWIAVLGSLRRTQRDLARRVDDRSASLRASQERYRSLFQHMMEGAAYCRMLYEDGRPQDFVYLEVNEAFEGLTGLRNVSGKKVSEVIPGLRESNPALFETYGRVALTGKPERFETYLQPLDMWLAVSVYGPQKEHFVAVFDVITARKRTEKGLRESEDRFRQASLSITDIAYSCIRQSDGDPLIDWVTGATESFSGYSNDEFQALGSWESLVLEEDRALFEQNVKGLAPGSSGKCALRLRKKDGGVVWVASYCRSVAPTEEPGQVRLYGGLRDITLRKQAEAALRESEERHRAILQTAMDGFWRADAQGRLLEVNDAYCRMSGYSERELLGMSTSQLQAVLTPGDAVARMQKIVAQGESRFEGQHRRKDGSLFDVEVSVQYQPANGGQFAAFLHDITKRKRAQKALTQRNDALLAEVAAREKTQVELAEARDAALEATRLKAEFLANMSHEIRTPLNGIIGMTELALDTDLSAEQREYLGLVKGSGESLLAIVNDILDFSKIEAGRLVLDPTEFSMRDALDDTLRPLALRAQKKGLELFCDVQGEVPETLVADAGRLRQVLVNLVGNAIKFTKQGEVLVSVWTEPQEAPNTADAVLHVAVSDTGIGIPADRQSMIFDAFSQADGSITRTYGGTGLGLTISSNIVRMMGGRIWVESTPGRGATFHFTVRVQVQPTQAPADAVSPGLAGLPVLVVDDNATNRRIIEKTLEKWQMRPALADSGEAALAAIREARDRGQPFRLMLLDVTMPEMDGFMVARRLREDDGLTTPTIMMLTSSGDAGDTARCRELGIAAYFVKPVKQAALRQAILAALGRPSVGRVLSMPPAMQGHGPSLRILLAEDNVVNQRVAIGLLENAGHAVTLARDGREALAALEGSMTFDLVLMDVQMPEMGGTEATAVIRERERAHGGHLPIIALTAHALTGDRERCLAAGADGYVAKPIVRADLFKEIDAVVGHGEAPPARTKPAAAFDEDALLARVGGSQALMREVIDLFLEDCPRLLSAVRQGLADGDGAAVHRTAHTLKGSAGNFGAQAVIALARRLEAHAREGNIPASDRVFSMLEAEIGRLMEELAAAQEIAPCAS
jgi:two-component system, sensor histidine kinase and response regulator